MPQWIHDRARHLREDNPSMPEHMSFAIATQQSHAAGKTPKSYGTKEGRREARRKYDAPPSSYDQSADPSHKAKSSSARWAAFADELQKISAALVPEISSARAGLNPARSVRRAPWTAPPADKVPEPSGPSPTVPPPPRVTT